jgi:hypothetical protein
MTDKQEQDDLTITYMSGYYDGKKKREWVGLTHEEVDSWELPDCPTVFEFVQFIEAKLKEKNT